MGPWCHETTARAALLEQGFLVTLVRLVSNVQVCQGCQSDSLGGFATLPLKKGQKGVVLVGAWWESERDRGLSLNRDDAAQTTQGSCREEFRVV